MKTITLRNIPSSVLRAIRRRAKLKKISVNRAVIELLEERVGIRHGVKRVTYDDLDDLAGTWSEKEATRFDEAIRATRQIDKEMWR